MISRAIGVLLALLPFAAGKATQPELLLLDPGIPIEQAWRSMTFGPETEYARVGVDGNDYIRATGRNSASGLYREVSYSVVEHPWLAWTWRVDQVQPSADIRSAERDDFAAAIYLIFGRPGVLQNQPPALVYVWTSARTPKDAIVVSPRHPDSVRFVVVRSGQGRLGESLVERRNAVEDYRRAFGENPPDEVGAIAIWTDNDQTNEPVRAYYGTVQALAR